MVVTAGIRNLIREGKTHQIYSLMETGGELGMQTMDRSLAVHVRQGLVAADEAARAAVDYDNYRRWLSHL